MKICDDLNSKAEILAKGRHNKLLYIVTAFQTIFLPLQTITAIYGMNFDEFPVGFPDMCNLGIEFSLQLSHLLGLLYYICYYCMGHSFTILYLFNKQKKRDISYQP